MQAGSRSGGRARPVRGWGWAGAAVALWAGGRCWWLVAERAGGDTLWEEPLERRGGQGGGRSR